MSDNATKIQFSEEEKKRISTSSTAGGVLGLLVATGFISTFLVEENKPMNLKWWLIGVGCASVGYLVGGKIAAEFAKKKIVSEKQLIK